jgi:hypothetical protein
VALVLGLALLLNAGAAESVTVVGKRSPGPRDSEGGWQGIEFGPTFSLPIAAGSASREELGLDAGLSLTARLSPGFGAGLDVAYHYWPVSAEFKQTYNELLHRQLFNTLEVGGGTWGLSALQLTGHVRFVAPTDGALRPWARVGGGLYNVNPHISGYSGDAGFFTITAGPWNPTRHFGWYCTTGCDLFNGPRSRAGLDATYHRLDSVDTYGSDLAVFTIGAHLLVGF